METSTVASASQQKRNRPGGLWRLDRGQAVILVSASAVVIALLPVSASAALLAGCGALLAILIRPWLGLPLLALAIPFAALQPLPVGNLPIDGADALLLVIVLAWIAQGLVRGQVVLPPTPLAGAMLLLVAALSLSLLNAPSYREGLPELLKWVQVLILYWCVAACLPARHVGWLLAGMLAAGAGQALLGLYQFLTQTGPEPFVLLGRFMRASGTFGQPNPYAGYLGLVAPLAISLALWAWTAGQAWWLRLGLTGIAMLTSLGLLLSWSRGAWIAFAAATMVVVLAHARRAAPLVVLVGALAIGLAFLLGAADLLPGSVIGRLSDLEEYLGLVDIRSVEIDDANFSVIERVAHWQAALAMWADKPWLGVGIGNYATVYPDFALPRWQEPLGHAHNVYLNFAAEAGLLGFLSYLVLWLAAGWQALRALNRGDLLGAAIAAGVLGVLTHATIHNLFDNLWVQHSYLQLALLLGMLAVLQARPAPGEPTGVRPSLAVT